jgi:anti-sigma regulatory factor (Ser/Thr protein kinase)
MSTIDNTIVIGQELNTLSFESILTNTIPLIVFGNSEPILFDLSATKSIKIGGMVNLLVLLGAIKEHFRKSQWTEKPIFIVPPVGEALDYLTRMHFFKISRDHSWLDNSLMSDNVLYNKQQKEAKSLSRRRLNARGGGTYFPIRYVPQGSSHDNFESECRKLANEVRAYLLPLMATHRTSLGNESMRQILMTVIEIYKNIYDHSSSWGITGMETTDSNIIMSFVDIGLGIRRTLEPVLLQCYEYEEITDLLSIKESIKKGRSSSENSRSDKANNSNMGLGLFIVKENIDKFGGKLMIRSGRSLYFSDREAESVTYFPGTQIHISIPRRKIS